MESRTVPAHGTPAASQTCSMNLSGRWREAIAPDVEIKAHAQGGLSCLFWGGGGRGAGGQGQASVYSCADGLQEESNSRGWRRRPSKIEAVSRCNIAHQSPADTKSVSKRAWRIVQRVLSCEESTGHCGRARRQEAPQLPWKVRRHQSQAPKVS